MSEQQKPCDVFADLGWDIDLGDCILSQEEIDSITIDPNEFMSMAEYAALSMGTTNPSSQEIDMTGYNTILDDFIAAGNFGVPAEYQEMDTTDFPQATNITDYNGIVGDGLPAATYEDPIDQFMGEIEYTEFPMTTGDFDANFPNGDCFSAEQFTSPLVQDLDQIIVEKINQKTTVTTDMIDPDLLAISPEAAVAYTSQYDCDPLSGHEAADHSLFYAPDGVPEQQYPDIHLDNTSLFGDDASATASSPAAPVLQLPKSKMFFPTQPTRKPEPVKKSKPVEEKPVKKSKHAKKSQPQPEEQVAAPAVTFEFPASPVQRVFKKLTGVPALTVTGQISVTQKHRGPDGGLVNRYYPYSVYKPLPRWGQFTYNSRGYLNEDIKFTASNIADFIHSTFISASIHLTNTNISSTSDHPLGENLVLRVEKHPYEIKSRETGKPQYTCCRAKKCDLSRDRKFTVGDIRVAIDEVTGRFSPNQVQNNCPYFAAGYIHLECLEGLINIAPLVASGIIVPDDRQTLPHEPEKITKQGPPTNNKMGLIKKQLRQFDIWKTAHPADSKWAVEQHTLNAILWISGQRPGRIRSRFPPGVTAKSVAKFLKENRTANGWGGRRMARGTVAELQQKLKEGKSHEIIAPRNGPSGKKGMFIGGAAKKKALKDKKRRHEEASDEEPSSGSSSESDVPTTRKYKKRRGNNVKYEDPIASSPDERVTYFESESTLPQKKDDGFKVFESDEPVEEDATERHHRASPRIKKEIESYVISDDDDSDKENMDPSWKRNGSVF